MTNATEREQIVACAADDHECAEGGLAHDTISQRPQRLRCHLIPESEFHERSENCWCNPQLVEDGRVWQHNRRFRTKAFPFVFFGAFIAMFVLGLIVVIAK